MALRDVPGGVALAVKAVPGSSRDRIAGVLGDRLKINVCAAAEKGKANEAIARVLAEALGVPARDVALMSGPARLLKEFMIGRLTAAQVRRRLEAL